MWGRIRFRRRGKVTYGSFGEQHTTIVGVRYLTSLDLTVSKLRGLEAGAGADGALQHAACGERIGFGAIGQGSGTEDGGGMKVNVAYQVKVGGRITYDDGRPGHRGAEATILEVAGGHGMSASAVSRL